MRRRAVNIGSLVILLAIGGQMVAQPHVGFEQTRAAPIPVYVLTGCIGSGAYCLSIESIYRPLNVAGILVWGPRGVLWTWYACVPGTTSGRCRR